MQDVAHQPVLKIPKIETQQIYEIQSAKENIETIIQSTVLLATANVRVQKGMQISKNCRALMDAGAQMNLITCECKDELKLPAIKCNQMANGVTGSQMLTRKVRIFILPSFESNHSIQVELFVMDDFCDEIPSVEIPTEVPTGIKLADPSFRIPARVQMLLGAEIWAKIIGDILYKHIDGTVLQETFLGYICFGRVVISKDECNSKCFNLTLQKSEEQDLCELIQKFWAIEEPHDSQDCQKTDEEHQAETFFKQTYRRNAYGRYIVQIPLKQNAFPIADSRSIALRRFHQLENKLNRNPDLKIKYIKFMREYEQLGHMKTAERPPIKEETVYIPHHAVDIENRFRVVFDGSFKNVAGIKFNKLQLIGPKLQLDLQDQLLCFRLNKIAFTADITKMFRQVLLDESQWDLSRIFWRENTTDQLKEYWLTTVTYGLASSVYSAVRAMVQCARDCAAQFPLAAHKIENCFYMDDGLMGAENVQLAIQLAKEVEYVLLQGGFKLSKWASNSKKLLAAMAEQPNDKIVTIGDNEEAKVLGIGWVTNEDQFVIKVDTTGVLSADTKRKMLSKIAKIYDPDGFISPVVTAFKILMQNLWCIKNVDWDSQLPESIKTQWRKMCAELESLKLFHVPRWTNTSSDTITQVHGFADASMKAYGCVIYLRTIDAAGNIKCILFFAKSRVAPLKKLTIPRLELAAAELLSEQMLRVKQRCGLKENRYFYWTDSTIALGWITKSTNELKTFVSNRVQKIQNRSNKREWQHVSSEDNPADLVSRGMNVHNFLQSKIWLHGPKWLSQPEQDWPKPKIEISEDRKEEYLKELKPSNVNEKIVAPIMYRNSKDTLIHTISGWYKLLRITSLVFRFIRNTQTKIRKNRRLGRYIYVEEFENAANYWIKIAQAESYRAEIKCLKTNDDKFPSKSKIACLRPFLDKNGVLRVGGRLDNAVVKYSRRHSIIVPPNSRVCTLILQQAHHTTLCGGVQLMMAFIRNHYWIRCLRAKAKSIVLRCVKCIRQSGRTSEQIMSDLPIDRLKPARPFINIGIDLAGPINIRATETVQKNTRNRAVLNQGRKGYICVFVCLVTRAIHLEPVMDISAKAFLRAYKRFAGRRGACEIIYSDNGTNFVRANKDLKMAVKTWQTKPVQDFISWSGTQWNFITPSAPHQGGFWEAAVKQTKMHLKKVIGADKYSYEALSTLLVEIEACLNSRPICAMSDDPDDMIALTPAHFIIGEPLKLPLPVRHFEPPKLAVGFYNELQARINTFWKVWSEDYLSSLMERPKWKIEQENLKAGKLVLIKNENLAPTYWAMGRIISVKKSADGFVRTAKIKVGAVELDRPVQKLIVLPVDDELEYYK